MNRLNCFLKSIVALSFATCAIYAAQPLSIGTYGLSTGGNPATVMKEVAVEGQSFTSAVEINVPARFIYPWAIQYATDVSSPIAKNDVLEAVFYFRSANNNPAYICLVVEYDNGRVLFVQFCDQAQGTRWQRVRVPFIVPDDYTSGVGIRFRVGQELQKIQLGGIQFINHGQVSLASLEDSCGYDGMETNAPWRARAAADIEKYRKGNLKIAIKDAGGNPLSGAPVSVTMKKHEFHFGCLADHNMDDAAVSPKFKEEFKRFFNYATVSTKWPQFDSDWNKGRVMRLFRWLRSDSIDARGHVLVYPAFSYNSPWVKEKYENDKEGLRQAIYDFIKETVDSANTYVTEWDVVNELGMQNPDFITMLGMDEVVNWFKKTREAAGPDKLLYYNENAVMAQNGTNIVYQEFVENNFKNFTEKGAPVTAMGIQGHTGINVVRPEIIFKVLDRFARLGVPIKSTEFSLDIQSEALQARYLEDYMTTHFSHPAVNGIMLWGFWEGNMWLNKKALMSPDWKIRPAGTSWLRLSREVWWTKPATLTTGSDGTASLRGFRGDYEIVVGTGSAKRTYSVKHYAPETFVTIEGESLHVPVIPGSADATHLPARCFYQKGQLHLENLVSPATISIYATNGKCLMQQSMPATGDKHAVISLDKTMTPGMYIVTINRANNSVLRSTIIHSGR